MEVVSPPYGLMMLRETKWGAGMPERKHKYRTSRRPELEAIGATGTKWEFEAVSARLVCGVA